ncbi:MAG TPA: response regulator [Parafilimonas sp.]|jgi:two-component system response regulator
MAVKKILMIDDDDEDRMLMQDMFAEIGAPDVAHYEESGETALSYLDALAENERPSVIVLDLNMPKLNGTQVLRLLKTDERFKNITVIIYSTSVNNIEKEETLKLGALSYVIKPSSYEEYLEKARYFNSLSSSLSEKAQ